MPNTAAQIDRFFRKRGAPIAGTGRLFVRFAQRFNVDPYELAAIAAKETEGGKTGTGTPSSGYGAFGMGPGIRYPGYGAAIRAAAKNLGGPTYRGKNLRGRTSMWVAGTAPTPTTARYTRDIREIMQALGGPAPAGGGGRGGGGGGRPPRPGRPGRAAQPALPGIPGVSGLPPLTLYNPTPQLEALGEMIGVPWTTPLPDITLPGIPGIPAVKGRPGRPGRSGRPGRPGTKPGGAGGPVTYSGSYALPVATPIGGSDFSYVDAEGAPDSRGVGHHAGHDWFGDAGTPVRAPAAGKIVEVKPGGSHSGQVFGGTVKVQAPNGMVFVFRHIDPRGVKVGQRVKAGQQIAAITRWDDGSDHTHHEIWKTLGGGYNYENMLDPVVFYGRGRKKRKKKR